MHAYRRILLCITAAVLWSNLAIAGEYDEIIDKIPRHEEINDWKPVVGKVDEQEYLAIQLDIGDRTKNLFEPVLIFALIKEGRSYEPFAVWRIANLNTDLDVDFRNNSIYVRYSTAHHGVYSSTYQFKRRAGIFQLVGIETDSSTNDYNEKTQRQFFVRSRASVNLLTAKAVISARRVEMHTRRENKKFVQRTVPIREGAPIPLKQFDPYNFHEDFLCHYFDNNLQLINSCKK